MESADKQHETKVQALRVAQAELKSLKPDRSVYVKKGDILFKSSQPAATALVNNKLKDLQLQQQQQG